MGTKPQLMIFSERDNFIFSHQRIIKTIFVSSFYELTAFPDRLEKAKRLLALKPWLLFNAAIVWALMPKLLIYNYIAVIKEGIRRFLVRQLD